MTKAERTRNLRWRKPALMDLSYKAITTFLSEIIEKCSNIYWAVNDDDMLTNALDGDEEEAWDFKIAFTYLEGEAYKLQQELHENFYWDDDAEKSFNDMSAALIGDRYDTVGFDDYEEKYYSLVSYDQDLAYSEAGKRVMRMTKAEMLAKIGQTLGIILSFQNVQLKYEYLKSTIDIFQDKNMSVLQTIKDIEKAYEEANENNFIGDKAKKFDRMINDLPDMFWVE